MGGGMGESWPRVGRPFGVFKVPFWLFAICLDVCYIPRFCVLGFTLLHFTLEMVSSASLHFVLPFSRLFCSFHFFLLFPFSIQKKNWSLFCAFNGLVVNRFLTSFSVSRIFVSVVVVDPHLLPRVDLIVLFFPF